MFIPGIVAGKTYPTGYVADAVRFDGTNDYLIKGSAISGLSDGKQGTISFWFRWDGNTTDTYQTVLRIGSPSSNADWGFLTYIETNTKHVLTALKNTSGTIIANRYTGNSAFIANEWNHYMCAYDLSTTTMYVYLNGVDVTTNSTTPQNQNIDYTWTSASICAREPNPSTTRVSGDIAELWFDDSYVDITNPTEYGKFASGLPLAPVFLGTDGSTPTGTQPLIYFSGNANAWNTGTNHGSGGNFTMVGAVDESVNKPVLEGT